MFILYTYFVPGNILGTSEITEQKDSYTYEAYILVEYLRTFSI